MNILNIVQILTIILASITGFICYRDPAQAIEIQRKFYARINWRIEPIDLNKELKNTKIMGMLSLIIAMLILVSFIQSLL